MGFCWIQRTKEIMEFGGKASHWLIPIRLVSQWLCFPPISPLYFGILIFRSLILGWSQLTSCITESDSCDILYRVIIQLMDKSTTL